MFHPLAEKIRKGFTVRGSDKKRLGKVVNVRNDTFVLEKGFFFPKDYSLPLTDIVEIRGRVVFVLGTRDELGIRGGFWDAFAGLAGPGQITRERVAELRREYHPGQTAKEENPQKGRNDDRPRSS